MKTSGNRIGAIIVGLIVILVGAGIAARNMGYELDLSLLLFKGWWTLFIIIPGVIGLFKADSNKVFDVILIALGVALLVSQYMELHIWSWIAPVAIIGVGVSIVSGAFRKSDKGKNDTVNNDNKDEEKNDAK